MVTHNADLQVIVANCWSLSESRLPQLRHLSCGLEDPAIRRAVCEVFEGGVEAVK